MRAKSASAAVMIVSALLACPVRGAQTARPTHRSAFPAVTATCKRLVEEVVASDASDQPTSTVWTNLTDGLVNFTSTRVGCVIVTLSGDVTAPGEFMFVRALLDARTPCTPSDNLNNALFVADSGQVQETNAMTYVCTGIAVGTHSIQMQYESYVGGPVTFYGHTLTVAHN
jgi:hypothetical protein